MTVNVSKKTMVLIDVFILIITIVMLGGLFIEYSKTNNYVKTKGYIKKIDYKYIEGNKKVKIVVCKYSANGKEYIHTYETHMLMGLKFNKSMNVYYNPENPYQVRELQYSNIIATMGSLSIFMICLYITIKYKW